MPRRAGGDAAGRETAEAVRKLRFRHRKHQRAAARQLSVPLCPSGQVFRHRSESGDDGCLAGRLTVAQSQVSEARRSRDCGVLLRGVNRQGRVCVRRALSRHLFFNSRRRKPPCLFCGGFADAEETFDCARSLVPQTCGIQSPQHTASSPRTPPTL